MSGNAGKRKGSVKCKGPAKKLKEYSRDAPIDVSMNQEYTSDEFKQLFSRFWKGDTENLADSPASGYCAPFRCCQLHHFLQDAAFLDPLRDELLALDFTEKNNDLYKFHQTEDLGRCAAPHVSGLRRLLTGRLLEWLREVTGLPLTERVDMGCSSYEYTDTLLCHDDELEGRRIAFVLYLVPPWEEADGGTLDLFDRDESGQPRSVARSLLPASNSLVLFEVTAESFHQVSEVTSTDKRRLSVNGWFHGPPAPRPPPHVEAREEAGRPEHVEEETVYSWINPLYLAEETQATIRQQFEDDSEIQLEDFLLPERYAAVSAALRQADEWQLRGPANRRRVERCPSDRLPAAVAECVALLTSEAMFLVLSQLTGLVLHPLAVTSPGGRRLNGEAGGSQESDSDSDDDKDGSTARCRWSVRRWRPGSYTLVHDHDPGQREAALDARLCVGADRWQDDLGGFTSYIARGEDTELLSVSPASNALSLVYRDPETVQFVKHVNSRARDRPPFYDVVCTYYE